MALELKRGAKNAGHAHAGWSSVPLQLRRRILRKLRRANKRYLSKLRGRTRAAAASPGAVWLQRCRCVIR